VGVTTWAWDTFAGSPQQLRLLKRDLPGLVTVMRHTPGRTCCVQAGGNLGLYPKRLAQEFRRVYTFEPDPENFAKLRQNAPERNIIATQAALGADEQPVAISRVRRDGKHLHTHEGLTHVVGPGLIPCQRIDNLQLPVCDLIYLDVEGYELRALQGAILTLARCRPILALELNKNLGFVGLTEDFVVRFLAAQGYHRLWLDEVEQATLYSDQMFIPAERSVQRPSGTMAAGR
jgi:FkbM family methyltransferase